MHDPYVVAWEIPLPWPQRKTWRDRKAPRWGSTRSRRTNAENLGEPVYGWWRLCGYTTHVAGRAYGLKGFATIWHVEPGGRDSGEICKWWKDGKPSRRWRWHVHHWRVQVFFLRRLRRRVFERCTSCRRPFPWGYSGVGSSWDPPKRHFWVRDLGLYHFECHSAQERLRMLRRANEAQRFLLDVLALETGTPREAIVETLVVARSREGGFKDAHRLRLAMDWADESLRREVAEAADA